MASEQAQQDAPQGSQQPTGWSVSLLGCLDASTSGSSQLPWPWLLFKGSVCPAAMLGANETLFQGEEPADVCCLQPYSAFGPTCRTLNAALCGLGNDGLKLCAHTCLVQALCSCFCLGLPYVAWLAALQRQRVVTRHGLPHSEDDSLAAVCFPCSLVQVHALLQQQHEQQHTIHMQPLPPQPQLRAPKVQQMHASAAVTAAASGQQQHASPALSGAGPLTSAMSSSRALRALHTARSEGKACSGPRVLQPGDEPVQQREQDDGGSSDEASDVGVVNSPMAPGTQLQAPEVHEMPSATTHSARDGSGGDRRASPRPNSGSSNAAEQPLQVGPLTSARCRSSNGGAGGAHMPPRRPGMARHVRTGSLGDAGGDGPADGSKMAGAGVLPSSSGSPDPALPPGTAREGGRRGPGGPAVLASQSCQLPHGFYSSQQQQGARNPQEAPTSAAAAAATGAHAGVSRSLLGLRTAVGTSSSCSKLLQISQEDAPLWAHKATPGKGPRVAAGALQSSRGAGCGGNMPGAQEQHQQQRAEEEAGTPQAGYATLQSDICNFASWLPSPASPHSLSGAGELQASPEQQQHEARGEQPAAQQQQQQLQQRMRHLSDDDLCLMSPSAADLSSPSFVHAPSSQRPAPAAAGSSQAEQEHDGSSTGSGLDEASPSSAAVLRGDAAHAAAIPPPSKAAPRGAVGRLAALSTAWAHMSDVCNLGGSFDGGSSGGGSGRTGLTAALAQMAGAEAAEGAGSSADSAAAGSAEAAAAAAPKQQQAGGGSQRQAQRHAAAAGSWPDTAPSPAHATLTATTVSASSSSNGNNSVSAASGAAGTADSSLGEPDSSISHGGDAAGSSGDASVPGSSAISSTAGQQRGAAQSGSSGGGNRTPQTAASAGKAQQAAAAIDPQLLAAVTGTTSREQLTASQEELAAKLARLAFANPRAARQLAGIHKQQQQQLPGVAAAAAHAEPFWPTLMSDICNLGAASVANLDDVMGHDGGDDCLQQPEDSTEQEQQQQDTPSPRPSKGGAGAVSSGAAAAAACAVPRAPGRPVLQQPGAAAAASSRLGRVTSGGGSSVPPALPVPLTDAAAAAAAAVAAAAAAGAPSSSTAGPLRAAMLLRGLRPPPGGAHPAAGPPAPAMGALQSGVAGLRPPPSAAAGQLGAPEDSLVSMHDGGVVLYPQPEAWVAAAAAGQQHDNPLFTGSLATDAEGDTPRPASPGGGAAGGAGSASASAARRKQQQQQHAVWRRAVAVGALGLGLKGGSSGGKEARVGDDDEEGVQDRGGAALLSS